MKRQYVALAAALLAPSLWIACDETPNGCDAAKTSIEGQIESICTEAGYAASPFCACCVANLLYSMTDDCTCRELNFDTDTCYYATGAQADPGVRDAIEYANSICLGRLVSVPHLDAGLGAAMPQCKLAEPTGTGGGGTTTVSSASSSASGTAGPGGAPGTASSSSGMKGAGGG
jgi:hypothetical protein